MTAILEPFTGTSTKTGQPYTKHKFRGGDGWTYQTFSDTTIALARMAYETGDELLIRYRAMRFGRDVLAAQPIERPISCDVPLARRRRRGGVVWRLSLGC